MANWQSFEPTQFFPVPIQRSVTALDTAVRSVTTAGNTVAKALKVAQKLAGTARVNPVETALRKALDQIDKFVTGILTDTQCHAIIIPVRKKALRRGKDSMDLLEDFLKPSEPAYAFVQRARTTTAGPGMFFRTLVESVADAGDVNRPHFPSSYATVGACVLAGGETLQDLQVPVRLFATLFNGNVRMPATGTILPVVQNLRITTAALRGGTGVVLRWDPVPPVQNFPLLAPDVIVSQEIFLIRTTEPMQQGWAHWDDLFNGVQPSDSASDLQVKNNSRVIARIRNHGFVTSYTDTSNLLDPKKTYYFTACVRYTLNGVVQPMGNFSNVVRASRKYATPATAQAIPPDWVATPSLAQMFPPLNQAINKVRLGLSRLGSRTVSNTGGQQLLGQTIAQLERLIQQWEATAQDVRAVTDRLQAITAVGTPSGLYATVISSNTGGMDAWLAELSRRISDETDPTRPNLSDQSSVIGYVIVAGAPRPPDLAALLRLLEVFFGHHPKNPLYTILRDFDGNPAGTTTTPTATSPVLGYDAALKPSTVPTC